jgi:mannitol-specific phosphotransferase system IIBC component
MTSQPDKLFRDKLENFQQPAPTGAWDRIESNLVRPSHKLVWIRVAAGVALLATAAIVLWPAEKPETDIAKTTTQNPSTKKDSAQQQVDKKSESNNEPVNKQTETVVSPQEVNTVTLAKTEKQSPVQQPIYTVQDSALVNPVYETNVLIAEIQPEENLKSKTIVYTADEVNSKFLKKKLPPEATSDNKDASGIQKLIGLAYAAKNSEAGLGDLRQKKDDILALNFSKKKGEN